MATRLYCVATRSGHNGRVAEARTYRDSELGEFHVRLYVNGAYQPKADYFTDDADDAIGTAKIMAETAANSVE